jgi:hypothetical protein
LPPARAAKDNPAVRVVRGLALAGLLLAPPPAPAAGADAGVARWRGTVADEEVLELRGERFGRLGREHRGDEAAVSAPLPECECAVYARTLEGRALVSVDRQPSAANGYTARVTVRTERPFPEDVELEVVWLREPPSARPRRSAERRWEERPVDRLRFRGVVDGADLLDLRGDQLTVRHLRHLPIQSMDYRVTAPLPSRPVRLELVRLEGRGEVVLAGEPSAENGYTATVLVDDTDERGSDLYEFELVWERPQEDWEPPRERLLWSGEVDGEADVVVRRDRVTVENRSGRAVAGERAEQTAPLPAREVAASLRKLEGRGSVTIVEQPGPRNDYTLRLRIDDEKGGSDFYRVEVTWPR